MSLNGFDPFLEDLTIKVLPEKTDSVLKKKKKTNDD